jgi:hypothetical protein
MIDNGNKSVPIKLGYGVWGRERSRERESHLRNQEVKRDGRVQRKASQEGS